MPRWTGIVASSIVIHRARARLATTRVAAIPIAMRGPEPGVTLKPINALPENAQVNPVRRTDNVAPGFAMMASAVRPLAMGPVIAATAVIPALPVVFARL